MRRREFITFLGGAATWPLVARAQQPATPVIGFLSSRSPGESASVVAAFRQGLRETGFIEGQNSGSRSVAAAASLAIDVSILNAKSESELETVFAGLQGMRIGALVVSGEPFFDSQRDRIVGLAAKYTVPTIYAWREYVLAGGLMSYGNDLPELYLQAAIYAGRILKGEKPANLPVVQPTKFHMAVNAKTAKSLGIEVPPRLLGLANEVIE